MDAVDEPSAVALPVHPEDLGSMHEPLDEGNRSDGRRPRSIREPLWSLSG